jgi:hypothetical protein
MAIKQWKIRYTDKRVQSVDAEKFGIYDGRYVFSRNGEDVLSIAEKAVESVAAADIADPEAHAPRSVGV